MPLDLRDLAVRMKPQAEAVRGFLAWWLGELRDLADELTARLRPDAIRRVRLAISDHDLTLSAVDRRTAGTVIATAPRPANLSELPEALRALVPMDRHFHQIEVVLPPDVLLERSVTVPAQARRRLRSALSLQLPRLMPLQAEQIYFDAVPDAPDATGKQLVVSLAIVRRALVDAIVAALAQDRRHRVAVVGQRASNEASAVFHFADYLPPQLQKTDAWVRRLLVSAAGLGLLAVSITAFQYHQLERRLEQQLAETKADADKASELQAALEARLRRIHTLAGRMQPLDTATVLSSLTTALPGDAWIYQLQIEDHAVRIEGLTHDASAVAATLTHSDLFEHVALRSAVKNGTTDAERFDIALDLKAPTQ